MKSYLCSTFFFVLLSVPLAAMPSLNNRCGEKGINLVLPSESDMVAYNKECDTAYIDLKNLDRFKKNTNF